MKNNNASNDLGTFYAGNGNADRRSFQNVVKNIPGNNCEGNS